MVKKSTFLSPNRIKEDHVIQHGLVVDGTSLSLALREHEKLFMEVCKNCSAVLCCRMAPLQKAKVSGNIVRIAFEVLLSCFEEARISETALFVCLALFVTSVTFRFRVVCSEVSTCVFENWQVDGEVKTLPPSSSLFCLLSVQ